MTSGPLAEGSVFAGDYRVVRPLSSGGMGAVYVATQLSTGKERALKVMQPQLVASPEFRRRFEQEARIGARIASEHIVEVQAAGVDAPSGMPFIIMELLRGADLAQRVETRGPVPLGDARAIFEQLCHAVGAAHAAGIVHRDLKPENIFLAESLRAGASFVVKVLDFGIAKLAAEAGSKSTAAMGSPLWMSPEQTERAPITPAADVWALGLVVFYMLTGKPYWRAAWTAEPTVTQLLREICLEPISLASERAAEIGAAQLLPPGFDGWFAGCVTRAPAERFSDAQRAWSAFAALERPMSSPGFAVPSHASLAYGATMNAPAPAAPYVGSAVGRTTGGVASGAPEGRGQGGRGPLVIALGALAVVGVLIGGAVTFALVRRNAAVVTVATGATSSVPVAVVDTGTVEPIATLSSVSAPPPPPPVASPLATAARPPVVPSAKLADPSGMEAIPPARNDVPPVPTATATASAASQGPPFDKSAAAASLNIIAIQTCARSNGPTGPGRVTLTYVPSGYVSSASVDAPYAGTAVGGCIVSKYRKSVVPSFGGGPTTLTKGFTIR